MTPWRWIGRSTPVATGDQNPYGTAYKNWRSFTAIEGHDAAGDGFGNITEFMACPETYPGTANSPPPVATITTTASPTTTITVSPPTTTNLATATTTLNPEEGSVPLPRPQGWNLLSAASKGFSLLTTSKPGEGVWLQKN